MNTIRTAARAFLIVLRFKRFKDAIGKNPSSSNASLRDASKHTRDAKKITTRYRKLPIKP
jgi:hypothetical protein